MSVSLYRLFDDKHHLLYVGISASAIARLSQHISEKPWASEIAHVSVEHYETRAEAAEAEREAIRLERPRHNVVHNRREIEHVPTQKTHVRAEVLWVCVACKGLVADGEGYLHINYREIASVEQQQAEWDRANPGPSFTGTALMSMPEPACWVVHHTRCDPDIDSMDYVIEVERARTAAQLLSWTVHLMDKVWLSSTDWKRVVEETIRDLRVVA